MEFVSVLFFLALVPVLGVLLVVGIALFDSIRLRDVPPYFFLVHPVSEKLRPVRILRIVAACFSIAAISIPALAGWLFWETRVEAIPGTYHATGVWGSSTLILRADQTFTQEVQFMEYDEPSVPPYRQHPTQYKSITGQWEEHGRHYFDQWIVIKPIMDLGNQGKVYDTFDGSYGPVMFTGLGIEVDAGRDIVYRK